MKWIGMFQFLFVVTHKELFQEFNRDLKVLVSFRCYSTNFCSSGFIFVCFSFFSLLRRIGENTEIAIHYVLVSFRCYSESVITTERKKTFQFLFVVTISFAVLCNECSLVLVSFRCYLVFPKMSGSLLQCFSFFSLLRGGCGGGGGGYGGFQFLFVVTSSFSLQGYGNRVLVSFRCYFLFLFYLI